MEILKKERSVARRLFTKARNELKSHLESASEDRVKIEDEFRFLNEKANTLFDVDERIKIQFLSSNTVDEEEFLKDCESADEYKKEWIELQGMYERSIKNQQDRESKYDSASISSRASRFENRTLRLPKLELVKFDGNAKNWLSFWSSFKKIHLDMSIDADDKMAYLIQSMTADSPAAELIHSFPPCGENYQQAVEQLKSRYARDELLIEIYIRELLALVLQEAKSDNANTRNLSSLYDKLKTQLRALDTLGVTSEKYAAMLYPLVESALPADVLRVWERQRSRDEEGDVLNKLLSFLKIEVESEERIQITREGLTGKTEGKTPTASCLVSGNTEPSPSTSPVANRLLCIWCDKTTHGSHECIKAQKMTLEERKKLVTKKKACHICLKTNHSWRRCKMYVKCISCQKRHAVLLCPEINKPSTSCSDNSEHTLAANNNGTTLLQTLLLKIGPVTVRAFIDTGAQRSYIHRDIARKLQLKPTGEETLKHFLFGGVETKEETHQIYEFSVQDLNGKTSLKMTALSKEKICGYIPRIRNDSAINKKLKENKLILTDVGEDTPEISLLIGADYSAQLTIGSTIHIEKDLYAVQTKLGWTLQGKIPQQSKGIVATVDLSNAISHLWNLEVMGIEEPTACVNREKSERQAMEDFKETVTINEEGRYEVDLPWKIGHPELAENRDLAEKRLKSTTKRLEALKEVENYNKVFQEWLELGIIEVETDVNVPGHYLCHHAVIKESSLTTRVRPVFDASARDINGNSVNACLEKGQNFLELIPILLTRFRMHAVGVTSDIKKAFLQISLKEEDRRFLRFLWWSKEGEIIVYRHCRVVFGLTCSPFLLAATIIYHLERFSLTSYAKTAQILLESFYVDNCVASLKNEQETETFIEEAKQIMLDGKFELRGWMAAPVVNLCADQPNSTSVLGLIWDIRRDELRCNTTAVRQNKITKRELLSVCNKIFDPIGFTSPATLIPKLLLQKTWKLNISWDGQLPEEFCKEFKTWLEEIHLLNDCRIPRRLTTGCIESTKNSLHIFCDASKHAYATCVFLRSESESNDVTVQLILAKSRVTPVKEITMPRLELIAALMASRIFIQVQKALRLDDCEVHFWTDSSVVLTWITVDKEWSVFVRNRVREIRESTNKQDWKHINGSLNPADLPSRGCSFKKLVDSKWWEGPSWLKERRERWPTSLEVDPNLGQEEVKGRPGKEVVNNADCVDEQRFSTRLANLSKFSKIVRCLAWILRFIHNSKSVNKRHDALTLAEIDQAQTRLIRLIQQESFSGNKTLRGMKSLDLFQDEMEVTRVKTRLLLREDNENFKLPMLLPGKHPIVRKFVEQRHVQFHHAGLNFMSSLLRNDFWILGGRKLIRSVISKCITCKRFKATNYKTAAVPPLPRDRVKNAAVFQITGVDAAGPLFLKTGEKCWIIIFTCAVYRAIHLELVMAMSTESFLMALRRFVARRGRVQTIYSDNGTNFVGAENFFKNVVWEELKEYSLVHKIKWIFNPPAAPWWGGWWERLIQMVKQLLRRNLGRAVVSFTELETLICDLESVINSRPLTYISEDDKLRPLTPAMFLQGLEGSEVPDLDVVDANMLRGRYRFLQELRDGLRQRFRNEYLSTLTSRPQSGNRPIQRGDVVIVETDTKRIYWPLALVEDIFPGKDGLARVARIKTADGYRLRPVQKLFPLEGADQTQVQNGEQPEPVPQPVPTTSPGPVPQPAPTTSKFGRVVKVPRRLDL